MQLPRFLQDNRVSIAAALVLSGGGAAIATAWGFQLIGGYVPCKLCLEQRVPYYAALPVAALALGLALSGRTGVSRILLALTAAAFLYGGGIGVYQAGAEWGFWAGPTDCGGGSSTPEAAGLALMQALENTRLVSCTEASWRMFGLSFAGWNVVSSAGLVLVALWGAFARRGVAANSSE